ncbi:hypothetical protein THASP1DRAFT_29441 [Thamnocephalis sphaerospora]|uniref:Uncharacterized protein n=1 Tax=Thamnocephalis sphaerospora TaxID=78915 RepID=A0A4P9XRN3_9FUNG|nr:hypothetical protein THASP1DRAFT_29441 [Thamnocephalis sphaerospora]|eukprot:RKP08754.1 hypothetical protein THASP1DRAFT_29441 [Thamnocephalis sphaerospora]
MSTTVVYNVWPETFMTSVGALGVILCASNYVRYRQRDYILLGIIGSAHVISSALRICPQGCSAVRLAISEFSIGLVLPLLTIMIARLLFVWCLASQIAVPSTWPSMTNRFFHVVMLLFIPAVILYFAGQSRIYAGLIERGSSSTVAPIPTLGRSTAFSGACLLIAGLALWMLITMMLLGISMGMYWHGARRPYGIAAGGLPYKLKQLRVLLIALGILAVAATIHMLLGALAFYSLLGLSAPTVTLSSVASIAGTLVYGGAASLPTPPYSDYALGMSARGGYILALLPLVLAFGTVARMDELLLADYRYCRPKSDPKFARAEGYSKNLMLLRNNSGPRERRFLATEESAQAPPSSVVTPLSIASTTSGEHAKYNIARASLTQPRIPLTIKDNGDFESLHTLLHLSPNQEANDGLWSSHNEVLSGYPRNLIPVQAHDGTRAC